jgi:hypothetical protein
MNQEERLCLIINWFKDLIAEKLAIVQQDCKCSNYVTIFHKIYSNVNIYFSNCFIYLLFLADTIVYLKLKIHEAH